MPLRPRVTPVAQTPPGIRISHITDTGPAKCRFWESTPATAVAPGRGKGGRGRGGIDGRGRGRGVGRGGRGGIDAGRGGAISSQRNVVGTSSKIGGTCPCVPIPARLFLISQCQVESCFYAIIFAVPKQATGLARVVVEWTRWHKWLRLRQASQQRAGTAGPAQPERLCLCACECARARLRVRARVRAY